MPAPNGRANGSAIDNRRELVVHSVVAPAMIRPSTGQQFSNDRIKELIAELEVPFDPAVIEWRVTNTTKSGKLRGQVIPYADPRAYTDRLNSLFTPAGWTRKYSVHTSATFEWKPDQKTVAKGLFSLFLHQGKPMRVVPVFFALTILISGLLGALIAHLYSEPMNRYLRNRLCSARAAMHSQHEIETKAAPIPE
jgi:hypothetical protein